MKSRVMTYRVLLQIFLLSTLWLTAPTTDVSAATYYVSPGDDLSAAIAGLSPGDTLILRDGVYLSSMTINVTGTASQPITIRAEHDGQAVVDGQNLRKPCEISGSSWVNVEGVVCHHSSAMVFNIANSNHIYISRISAYQAGPDYNDHIFEIYRSENVTLEDCAATGRGRNAYIAFESDFITFRRCWGRYVTNGTQQGADWMQIYGSADCLIENCVGTRKPSDIYVDINQYWYASWNRNQDRVDRNRTVGCVFYGHDYHGLNVISANQQLHDNSVENTVFIGNDTPMGYGIPYTGIFQRVDDGFVMDRLTLVNHLTAVSLNHDSSNPWFDIIGTLTNSSILHSSNGINLTYYSQITVSLDHRYNNFYNVDNPYTGISRGIGEIFVSPGYNVTKYGKGAYLFVPPALKGRGLNGADIGAEVLYESVDGIPTRKRLWPWPMEERICAETAEFLGNGIEGVSVTYESHQVKYDYDGDGQPETYNCTDGIWKTLQGVYPDSTPTPTLTSTPKPTVIQTPTPTHPPTPLATSTPLSTHTPTSTLTKTPSPTHTSTPTHPPTPMATSTLLPTSTSTFAPTNTPTLTPTSTPMPTETHTSTPTNTPTPMATSTPLPAHTPTPTPINTPSPTNTLLPTSTPTRKTVQVFLPLIIKGWVQGD